MICYILQHERQTQTTQVRHARREFNTTATRTTRVQHKSYTNNTSATQVKKFDIDNDTSKNIFSRPYISYMANDRLQQEEKYHSKNYLLEMSRSHATMRSKSTPQKLNFVIKVIAIDCSSKCPCAFQRS